MLNNVALLTNLIKESNLTSQSKLSTIIKTLQKTDDIVRARELSKNIISGDFSNLKEVTIESLIESFSKTSFKENSSNPAIIDYDISKYNPILNLEHDVTTTKLKLEALQYKSNKRINELEEKNKKLLSTLSLINNMDLLEITYDTYNY